MKPIEIKKGIYWVGAIDWNARNFHGNTYATQRGTTYNAYLIKDDKIALVDTVLSPFGDEMMDRIKAIVDPAKIDYIIANHVETDHSGSLPQMMKLCPSVKVLGTAKCKEGLHRNYYLDMNFQVVKTSDKLSLGRRTLTFLEAPMIHWPDSMFTYCQEEALLLPNDAFGQHYATSQRFDDEVNQAELMDEALKYYANILWPLNAIILKKLEEVQKLNFPVDMIAPSHGVIWRKDPMKIVNTYASWAKQETHPKVVIVYETMWGATEKMAKEIAEGILACGIDVKLFEVNHTDRTQIIKEMYDAKGYIIGSSTHDNDMLPGIGGFLVFLRGLKPKNRIAATFGSYGWAGGATKCIEAVFREASIEIAQPALAIQYAPDQAKMVSCFEWGKAFAQKVKG